jgi:hypothetical protein
VVYGSAWVRAVCDCGKGCQKEQRLGDIVECWRRSTEKQHWTINDQISNSCPLTCSVALPRRCAEPNQQEDPANTEVAAAGLSDSAIRFSRPVIDSQEKVPAKISSQTRPTNDKMMLKTVYVHNS